VGQKHFEVIDTGGCVHGRGEGRHLIAIASKRQAEGHRDGERCVMVVDVTAGVDATGLKIAQKIAPERQACFLAVING